MDETIWQTRVDDYLAFATTAEHSSNPTGICAYLGQAHRDPDFVWPIENVTVESLQPVFDQIDNWEDTRDFRFMALHWMLALGQGDTPMTQLSPEVIAAIDERMLANRYAWDDPLPDDRLDNLWYWSENHIVITRAIEYLAGQRYPDETFAVTGLTGAEHLERAKPFILEWIDERAKLGFFEWHSNVYMLKNITPLHMLAELADDPEIVLAAAMALDMCLVDMAAHNQAGHVHGAAGSHVQEGQDVVARRGHLQRRQVRVRRHHGAVSIDERHRRHATSARARATGRRSW